MAYGLGLLKGLGVTLKHTFEKKSLVVQYPEQRPVLQERFRGNLCFRFENCTSCGLCVKACPNDVLSLDIAKADGKRKLMTYTMDMQYCMYCNLCVETCNFDALYWEHEFEKTKFTREEIKVIYPRPADMDAIEADREAHKAKLKQQQRTQELPDELTEATSPDLALMAKSPEVLTELAGKPENIAWLNQALQQNRSMHDRLLAMVEAGEMAKAQKVATALIQKAAGQREGES